MGQTSPYEVKLRLVITDFQEPPSEISRLLGVKPTKTWLRGDPVTDNATIQYKMNGWQVVVSTESGKTSMLELVDELISIFGNKVENFKKLPKEAEVLLSCIVFPHKYCPELGFRPDQIEFLSKISASVDFDIYT